MNVQAQVTELIGQMRAAACRHNLRAYETASDSLETFLKVHLVPEPQFDWAPYRLTTRARTIAGYLHLNFGKPRSKEQILDAMYYDRPNDIPEIKIIDVFISKLRWKLREGNSPYAIETVWGFGYRMVDAEGAVTPLGARPDKETLKGYFTDWNGIKLARPSAVLAERLCNPLGTSIPFPQEKREYHRITSLIYNLRRKLHGKYEISSERGVGFKMVAI